MALPPEPFPKTKSGRTQETNPLKESISNTLEAYELPAPVSNNVWVFIPSISTRMIGHTFPCSPSLLAVSPTSEMIRGLKTLKTSRFFDMSSDLKLSSDFALSSYNYLNVNPVSQII